MERRPTRPHPARRRAQGGKARLQEQGARACAGVAGRRKHGSGRFGFDVTARGGSAGPRRMGFMQEDALMLELHSWRDATRDPVLDALHASAPLVEAKHLGNLRRAAQPFDHRRVGVSVFAHTPN